MLRTIARTLVVATCLGALLTTTMPAGAQASAWRPGEPVFEPPRATTPIVGVQYHATWDDKSPQTRDRILNEFEAAGVQYVRLDISWAMLQPDSPDSYDMQYWVPQIDQRMQELRAHGIKALIVFHWAPKWSSGTTERNGVPRDPVEFGEAAAWAAHRWQDDTVAIELLNEPDSDYFLANTDPLTFTNLVRAAYPRIKAVAPDVQVIAGAPEYVNTPWYEKFYAFGGADHYDALGIHPYIGEADASPSACIPSEIRYYPCNIPNLISLMAAYGDSDKGIWATEYGWSTHTNATYPSPVPNWKRGVTREQQAQYLIEMQNVLSQWPQVKASFWYTAWDRDTGDAQVDNYGLLTRDFQRKPAYYAMRCVASGVCGQPTTVPASTPVTVPNSSAIGKVRVLRARAKGLKRVKVTWRPPATGTVTGYRVRWSSKPKQWRKRTVTKPRVVLPKPRKAQRLKVNVRAVGAAGTGPAANVRFPRR